MPRPHVVREQSHGSMRHRATRCKNAAEVVDPPFDEPNVAQHAVLARPRKRRPALGREHEPPVLLLQVVEAQIARGHEVGPEALEDGAPVVQVVDGGTRLLYVPPSSSEIGFGRPRS